MTRAATPWLWTVALATVLVALVFAAFGAWLLGDVLPPGTELIVDGRRYALHDWLPASAGGWLLLATGVLAIALLVVVAVPLLLLATLVVSAVVGGASVGALLLALLALPLLLLRRRRKPGAT